MARLSINIIIYNAKELAYIPFLLESLKQQTFQDFSFILVNNAAPQSVFAEFEQAVKALGKPYQVINNTENVGFSTGHNQAYRLTKTEYVLLQNPDMFVAPDTLQKMIDLLDAHHDMVAVAPRLMRWDFGKVEAMRASGKSITESAQAGFTSSIDAIGIRLFKNRRAVEWLTRQIWAKDSDSVDVRRLYEKEVTEVFGVSGAFPMYRKAVLDQCVLPDGNIFDATYHSYKEDLDLAYRLRNLGYTSYVILHAVAYHDRTGAGPKEMGDWAAIKNKKIQSGYVRFHSYKNHLRTLFKNEYWQNIFLDGPFIFWYEFKKFCFLLMTAPLELARAWGEIFKHWGYMRTARHHIVQNRKMYWKGLRRWF